MRSSPYRLPITAFLVLTACLDASNADSSHSRATELVGQGRFEEALQITTALVRSNPSAANLRVHAEACEGAGRYQDAAEAYLRAAEIYLKLGDAGAYRVLQRKGSSLASEVRIFVEDPSAEPPASVFTGAKFEPLYGCFLGAFVDDDTNLQTGALLDWRRVGDKAKFAQLSGRPHASYFNYFQYGKTFPVDWVAHLRQIGAAPQLAWEGASHRLGLVEDNAYLREFARQACLADVPIFLRFASEMNGDWNDYGSPALYIRNFRLVHDVMAAEAPNVAMVWSPNCTPETNINDYYPGDEYVDWVGLSMYSTICRNGNPAQMCDRDDPTDNLRYVYRLYSERKPIMISEHGITQYCAATRRDVADWAARKCRYLHSALPRLFPRVKMISWFSRNNIDLPTDPSRKLNNYSLTEKEPLLRAYRESIASPYFLERVPRRPWEHSPLPPVISPLGEDHRLSGRVTLSAWVKCYDDRPVVKWWIDDAEVARSETIPFEVELDSTRFENGRHAVKVVAYDSQGRTAAKQQIVFRVQN